MQSCKAGETADYRPLGDRETVLPGDVWQDHTGAWVPVDEYYPAHHTPDEVGLHHFCRPIARPAPAEPTVYTDPKVPPPGYVLLECGEPIPAECMVFLYPSGPGPRQWRAMEMPAYTGKPYNPHMLAPFARPISVTPVPQPEPAINPGEGWRLLGDDEVLEPSDECPDGGRDKWVPTIFAGRRVGDAADCPYRRRTTPPPLTPDDIRRAAITEAARDDVLPAMRFGVNCVDGVRRYAASYGEACRVFDEAARATLAKRGGQS